MASFDDLAFAPPLSATSSVAPSSALPADLFCKDCNEVPSQTTPDRKRCLICGCELESRSNTINPGLSAYIPTRPSDLTERDFDGLIQQLLETLGGEFGITNEARRPAAESAVSNLGSFIADQASTIEVAIAVSGIKGEVVAVPANFGPCESLPRASVCLAQPLDGARDLQNADEIKGKIVVMERGTCTFAQKVLRAQASGAIAVIIIQTFDVWPYTMTDSKGESSKINIPAFMLSMKQGTRFLEYLQEKHAIGPAEVAPSAEITVHKDARECVICQVDMSIEMTLTRMPCQHMFHTDCLHQWLKIGNSCPICRVEIPSKNGSVSAAAAQALGTPAWGEWFS